MTISPPNRTSRSRSNATSASLKSNTLNRYRSPVGEGYAPPGPKGNWSFLLLLLPVLCCGGPFIVLALATAGTMVLGVAAGIVVALVAVAALIIVRRRRATNCCETPLVKGR